jgi:hypothetical protein
MNKIQIKAKEDLLNFYEEYLKIKNLKKTSKKAKIIYNKYTPQKFLLNETTTNYLENLFGIAYYNNNEGINIPNKKETINIIKELKK